MFYQELTFRISKNNIKIFLFLIIGVVCLLHPNIGQAQTYKSKKTKYLNYYSGQIIDHSFFKTVVRVAKKNNYKKKFGTNVITLGFGTQSEHAGTLITELTQKESFEQPYFVSLYPQDKLGSIVFEDDIVIDYEGFIFILPAVTDSILVKRISKKSVKKVYDTKITIEVPFIRFENGVGVEEDRKKLYHML